MGIIGFIGCVTILALTYYGTYYFVMRSLINDLRKDEES